MTSDIHRASAAARAAIARKPALWASILATGVGSAIVIWIAMRDLSVGIKLPVILIAAGLNVLIGAGYASDFESDDSEAA